MADKAANAAAFYDCSICMETATEPVVTLCGHLYCWRCIYRWMRNGHNVCPVCKSGVTRDTVIPLYGRGSEPVDPRSGVRAGAGGGDGGGAAAPAHAANAAAEHTTAGTAGTAGNSEGQVPPEAGGGGGGDSVPSRPRAQRTEPPPNGGAGGADGWAGGGGGGTAAGFVTAGFGFFPSLFALQFHSIAPPPRPRGAPPLTREEEAQLLHSRLLFAVGAGVILFLLLL